MENLWREVLNAYPNCTVQKHKLCTLNRLTEEKFLSLLESYTWLSFPCTLYLLQFLRQHMLKVGLFHTGDSTEVTRVGGGVGKSQRESVQQYGKRGSFVLSYQLLGSQSILYFRKARFY